MDPITFAVILALSGKVVGSLVLDQAKQLLSTLVGGVIEAAGERMVFEKVPTFLKNLRTTDPALNHDLERSTREAYLLATLELVRQAESRTDTDPSLSLLRRLRKGVEADINNVSNTLPKQLDDVELLLLKPEEVPGARMERMRATLRANLDADAQRWIGGPLPPMVESLLESGWTLDTSFQKNVPRDWFTLIALAFVEKLKTDTRLRSVFESRLLAQIATGEPRASAIATFEGFTAQLDRLVLPLQRIEDSLHVVLQELAEIKSRVDSLSADLFTQRAVDIARERRLFDVREEQLLAKIEERDQHLRVLRLDLNQTQQQQAATQVQLDQVIAEKTQLVERVAAMNREYAGEVAEYRKQMSALTDTTDPQLQQALRRFADGDRVGAMPVIERIKRAAMQAREKAATSRNAADLREVAALKAVMKDRGEATTSELLPLWEEAQKLDPSYHWGWVELCRIYMDAGDLEKARWAAERSLECSGGKRSQSVSLHELGRVLVAAGELGEARRCFEQSLAIAENLAAANPRRADAQRDVAVFLERLGEVLVEAGDLTGARKHFEQHHTVLETLVAANPTSATAQRDVSVSFSKLGVVLVAAGELGEAKKRFEQSLAMDERLAAANPESAEAQRDVSVSLGKLGEVLVATRELGEAKKRFEQCHAVLEKLARSNPSSAAAQRDVSVSLNKLGDVLVAAGELGEARMRFEQSLAIRQKLAMSNPASAEAQRDVSVSLTKLGDVLVAAGEFGEARKRFEQSLAMDEKLAKANPESAQSQRDLITSCVKLAAVTGEKAYLARAHGIAEELEKAGRLAPRDAWMVTSLREQIG